MRLLRRWLNLSSGYAVAANMSWAKRGIPLLGETFDPRKC